MASVLVGLVGLVPGDFSAVFDLLHVFTFGLEKNPAEVVRCSGTAVVRGNFYHKFCIEICSLTNTTPQKRKEKNSRFNVHCNLANHTQNPVVAQLAPD